MIVAKVTSLTRAAARHKAAVLLLFAAILCSNRRASCFDRNSIDGKWNRGSSFNRVDDKAPQNLLQSFATRQQLKGKITFYRTQPTLGQSLQLEDTTETRTSDQEREAAKEKKLGRGSANQVGPKPTQANQVRSHNQVVPPVKRNSSRHLLFKRNSGDGGGLVRRTRVAAASVAQQQVVRVLAGARLSIPCGGNLTNELQLSGAASFALASAARRQQPGRGRSRQQQQQTAAPVGGNELGVALIVWHKDEQLDAPIFVADARGASSFRDLVQQPNVEWLRSGRASTEPQPRAGALPALRISDANANDAGLYTCTVEFNRAPTQTHQVKVEVVEPPKNMVVRDDAQQVLYSSLIGPYDEESRLALTCEVEPGHPQAGKVSWWQLDSIARLPTATAQAGGTNHFRPRGSKPGAAPVALDRASYVTTVSVDVASLSTSLDWFLGAHLTQRDALAFLATESSQVVLPQQFTAEEASAQLDRVRYWRLVRNQTMSNNENKLQATLELDSLSRANLGDEFLCLANNNDFSAPLNTTVKLNLNLKPVEVKIVNKSEQNFKINQKAVLECQVFGSKPSATIRWLLNGHELDVTTSSGENSELSDNNVVVPKGSVEKSSAQSRRFSELQRDINNLTKVSHLSFVPQLSDNQQVLTCAAHNPKIPNSPTISDTMTLNVQYPPRLSLEFGANINADSVKLKSGAFMDCNIDSNPQIDHFSWLFNSMPLAENLTAGILISNKTLVLQRVSIEQRGQYQCVAANSLGKTESNKLWLRPKFEPICDYSQTRTRYEVPLNQPTRIECHVLAEPSDDLHFTWKFNQTGPSGGSHNSNGGGGEDDYLRDSSLTSSSLEDVRQYETNFTRSHIVFTPKNRNQYGHYLCSASNLMGKQETPCVIQVVPSELPDPVLNCFVDNRTHNSFSVHCQPPAITASTPYASQNRKVNYILELYANDSAQQESSSSTTSASAASVATGGTHLKLRHPEQDESTLASSAASGSSGDDDTDDADEDGASDEHVRRAGNKNMLRNKQRVVRLTSGTPSFDVADLKPNTTYNILVFVQNSKGRSYPALQRANTRFAPADGQGGRVEFFNRKATGGDDNSPAADWFRWARFGLASSVAALFEQQESDEQAAAAWTRPIGAIALVVMLSAVTIVVVAFFANRILCRAGRRQQRQQPTKRATKARDLNGENQNNEEGGEELETEAASARKEGFSKRTRFAPTTDLTTTLRRTTTCAAANGSGSDTSRETNTDTTFVGCNGSPLTTSGQISGKRLDCSSGGTCGARFLTGTPPALLAKQLGERHKAPQSPQRHLVSAAGSDCQSDHSAEGHQFQRQSQDGKFVLRNSSACEPVYVISRNELRQAACGNASPSYIVAASQSDHCEQIQLIGPSSLTRQSQVVPFCPAYQQQENLDNTCTSLSAGTQLSSIATADSALAALDQVGAISCSPQPSQIDMFSGRCQLVESGGDHFAHHHVQLPSSLSIPVSLSDRLQVLSRPDSGRLATLQNQHQRRLSQEYLQQQSFGANMAAGGSFLTLAPASYEQANFGTARDDTCFAIDYSDCRAEPLGQQPEISPPIDFACDYRRFKEAFGIVGTTEDEQQQQYCSRTLDYPVGGSAQRQQRGAQQTTGRRNTLDVKEKVI